MILICRGFLKSLIRSYGSNIIEAGINKHQHKCNFTFRLDGECTKILLFKKVCIQVYHHFANIYAEYDANHIALGTVIPVAPSTVGVYNQTHVMYQTLLFTQLFPMQFPRTTPDGAPAVWTLKTLPDGPSSRHRVEKKIILPTDKVSKWLVQLCSRGGFGSKTEDCEAIGRAIKVVACIPPCFGFSPEDNQASLLGLLAKIKVQYLFLSA